MRLFNNFHKKVMLHNVRRIWSKVKLNLCNRSLCSKPRWEYVPSTTKLKNFKYFRWTDSRFLTCTSYTGDHMHAQYSSLLRTNGNYNTVKAWMFVKALQLRYIKPYVLNALTTKFLVWSTNICRTVLLNLEICQLNWSQIFPLYN
mgnify:CR=1 FL=1